jgi:hypothetical protein
MLYRAEPGSEPYRQLTRDNGAGSRNATSDQHEHAGQAWSGPDVTPCEPPYSHSRRPTVGTFDQFTRHSKSSVSTDDGQLAADQRSNRHPRKPLPASDQFVRQGADGERSPACGDGSRANRAHSKYDKPRVGLGRTGQVRQAVRLAGAHDRSGSVRDCHGLNPAGSACQSARHHRADSQTIYSRIIIFALLTTI